MRIRLIIFIFRLFHGGSDRTWAPTDTCYTWLDDIRIGTTYEDVAMQNVSRNEETSFLGEEIKVFSQTSGELRIDGLKGSAVVSIYSINGKKVKTLKARQSSAVLDVHDLGDGNFIIQVKDDKGKTIYNSQFIIHI